MVLLNPPSDPAQSKPDPEKQQDRGNAWKIALVTGTITGLIGIAGIVATTYTAIHNGDKQVKSQAQVALDNFLHAQRITAYAKFVADTNRLMDEYHKLYEAAVGNRARLATVSDELSRELDIHETFRESHAAVNIIGTTSASQSSNNFFGLPPKILSDGTKISSKTLDTATSDLESEIKDTCNLLNKPVTSCHVKNADWKALSSDWGKLRDDFVGAAQEVQHYSMRRRSAPS